ncbi:YqaA family protein [Lishizhenia sp.]|uniref:YqaA family protein n=1 Tax=Lishizhenia sp. TaxID=2497594 RepID=UPI00299F45AB|nr:YqaA family protein [Lishizhenia sp.]MDX1445516.1 YqaA family protein [Lishizhenia sp.]
MWLSFGWLGLFGITFLSATLLPFSSEVVLLLFLSEGYDPLTALFVATLGNSLGGATNYYIGAWGSSKLQKRFGSENKYKARWQVHIQRYGTFTAWLAWAPFIGDFIMLLLGVVRANKYWSFLYMTLGKFLRYYVVIFVYENW